MIINGGKIMELQDIINEAKENDEAIDSTILETLYPDPKELAEAYIKLDEEDIDVIEENQKSTDLVDAYHAYLHEVGKYPLLTQQQEQELTDRQVLRYRPDFQMAELSLP